MPAAVDKYTLSNENLDRRVKLTKEQKDEIKTIGDRMSIHAIAKLYGVSRRTIQFILDPKKLEENKKLRQQRGGWKQYYDKEKQVQATKNYREYKQSLLDKKVELAKV